MNNRRTPPAIIIGSGVVSLGVINDLVADDIPVVHISPKDSDIALRSWRPREKVVLGDCLDQTDELVDTLMDPARNWDGACLIPTIDPTIRIVSKNLDKLRQRFVTPVQSWDTLQPLIDKSALYRTARRVGVATPAFLLSDEFDRATEWSTSVGFPVIVKPVQTPEFFAVFGVKALEAGNPAELLQHLAAVQTHGLDVMVSEVIPGPPSNLISYRCIRNDDGQLPAEMCTQKLRTHPPEYGIGLVHRTIPINGSLRDDSCNLLNALGFVGFSNTEFKLDPRDEVYKLMEINPRPVNCQRLFRKAGINFAKLTYQAALGIPLNKKYEYKNNVHAIHNSADLYHFRSFAKRGFRGLRDFFAPYLSRRRVLLLSPIQDPKPFLYEFGRIFANKYQRLKSDLKRRWSPASGTGQTITGANKH